MWIADNKEEETVMKKKPGNSMVSREEIKARIAKERRLARSVRRSPRPLALPGMENRAIAPLERGAELYADIRDQRIELNRQESDLKQSLLRLMKQHGKTVYRHSGVLITVIPGEDDVKVRVLPAGETEAAPADAPVEDVAVEAAGV